MRKFNRDMQRQQRKVLLLIDNQKGLVCELESMISTLVVPLPAPTIRYLHPLRAGIIRTFQSNYRRNLLETYTEMAQQSPRGYDVTPPQQQQQQQKQKKKKGKHEQRLALECAHSAWQQVTATTIGNCFAHCDIVSARLEDGFSLAPDQPPASNHSTQFAPDLDTEASLMATQSALIQFQRDMKVPESCQLTIDDFLELERSQEQQQQQQQQRDQMEALPTDEELVSESKFLASQLAEEARYRKQEDERAAETAALAVSSESSLADPPARSNSPTRAIKPRPKQRGNVKARSFASRDASEEKLETEPADCRASSGIPTCADGALLTDRGGGSVPVVQRTSSSEPTRAPLSVQEMLVYLDRLEYSLPFYFGPSLLPLPAASSSSSSPASASLPYPVPPATLQHLHPVLSRPTTVPQPATQPLSRHHHPTFASRPSSQSQPPGNPASQIAGSSIQAAPSDPTRPPLPHAENHTDPTLDVGSGTLLGQRCAALDPPHHAPSPCDLTGEPPPPPPALPAHTVLPHQPLHLDAVLAGIRGLKERLTGAPPPSSSSTRPLLPPP
jgi:hypothetical protein